MVSRDMVGLLESRFSASFQRKAGIHLPQWQIVVSLIILLPKTHQITCEAMDLGGVGGVSTSCEASIGMVVLQFGGHHTVLSKNFRPTDGRLSFPNELFLFVFTLILQYKMSDNEFRRALAQ
jgi:hypothetical protein